MAMALFIGGLRRSKGRTGSETNIWYEVDGKAILRVTIPKGRGDIRTWTLNSIRNQLKLNHQQFKDFVKCPLEAQEYDAIIRSKGLL